MSRKRQRCGSDPPAGPRTEDVPDLLFLLLTLVAFGLLAVLVGVLDRRLSDDAPDVEPVAEPAVDRDAA